MIAQKNWRALCVAAGSTLMDLPGSAAGAFAAKPTETREPDPAPCVLPKVAEPCCFE